ncbi:hypothetical protein ACM66B_001398 [Microbotryomycetes sp. NB124-2]
MSLYAGIRLQKGAQPDKPVSSTSDNSASTPSIGVATSATSSLSPVKQDATPTGSKSNEQDKPAWSAALRFAPTIRKKPTAAATSAKPIASAFSKAFASADDANTTGVKTQRIVGNAKPSMQPIGGVSSSNSSSSNNNSSNTNSKPSTSSSATIQPVREPVASSSVPMAPSILKPVVPSSAQAVTETRTSRRRVIAKPPPMTLEDDDANGFKQTVQGKRPEQQRNSKRKKGKRKEDPALQFGDTTYDPSRPCDYAAFKAHVQAMRTQRRLEREERNRRERSYSESDYESGSDQQSDAEDRSNMLKKARLFAPPTSYEDPPSQRSAAEGQPPPTANPGLAPKNETGKEAYLRRLAMSAQPAQAAAPQLPPHRLPPPMFQSAQALSATAPSFTPQSVSFAPPSSFPPPPAPLAAPSFFAPPGSDEFPPFESTPPTRDPQATAAPAAPSFALSDAQAKAREIAARLSKLSGQPASQPPPPPEPVSAAPPVAAVSAPPPEPDNRSFADRMMAKFGWEQGKGLGANEAGITSALAVSRANPPPNPNSKKGKKAAAQQGEPVPTGISTKGATIIDAGREARIASQRAEFGEPSRVVLLTNLCGLGDVDDDLGSEVAEEANKFGVVERCMVWPVPGETRDDEAVRVFLVMSGLAGGYNAVKQFNGRFFGGRTVKARFYDEQAFQRGDRLQ